MVLYSHLKLNLPLSSFSFYSFYSFSMTWSFQQIQFFSVWRVFVVIWLVRYSSWYSFILLEPGYEILNSHFGMERKGGGESPFTSSCFLDLFFVCLFCLKVNYLRPFLFSIILDLHFPSICYRKLLSPPVVPASSSARVGVVRNFNLDDLAQFMPVSIEDLAF